MNNLVNSCRAQCPTCRKPFDKREGKGVFPLFFVIDRKPLAELEAEVEAEGLGTGGGGGGGSGGAGEAEVVAKYKVRDH